VSDVAYVSETIQACSVASVRRSGFATVIPDQNGKFEVSVPDFHAPANLGESEFEFRLVHQHGNLSLNQFHQRRVAKSLFGTVSLLGLRS
jgi:hypothetical protein